MDEHASLALSLRAWLDRASAAEDVNRYFADPRQVTDGEGPFSGRYFERFAGGGDRPETSDYFTANDLIAVEMLSVQVPPEISIAMLHGSLGRRLRSLLRQIPVDVAMGDPDALEHLESGSPADRAWGLLEQQVGCGYVTAGKLMARKRPHLVPVYDSVVRCALGAPNDFWTSLNSVLADETTGVRRRLAGLLAECRVPAEIGELRLLDVVVWMGHRGRHLRSGCTAPGTTGL